MQKGIISKSQLLKWSSLIQIFYERKNLIIDLVAFLFILLFVYTGINKLIAVDTLTYLLKSYPLIGSYSKVTAWGLPFIELITAILLFIPRSKLIGLYGSLFLMSGFTIYLVYMLIFAPKLPCTCGGMLQIMSWPQHLLFNVIFIGLAYFAIRLARSSKT